MNRVALGAALLVSCSEGPPGETRSSSDTRAALPEPSASSEGEARSAPSTAASLGMPTSSPVASVSTSPAARASASAAASAPAPTFLRDNPACPVPQGQPHWSWRRVHKVEGLTEPAVVLTLDVGAKLDNLEKVLDVLRAERVAATIFLYTAELAKSPRGGDLVRRMVADGHELANHTVSHKDLTKLDLEAAGEELDGVERFVRGHDPSWTTRPYFREPFLATNDEIDALVKARCYRPIWFTVDTADWRDDANAEKIEAAVFERRGKPREIEAGSIFIFHGSQAANLVALPRVIGRLRERGFGFLTLGAALARSSPPKKVSGAASP